MGWINPQSYIAIYIKLKYSVDNLYQAYNIGLRIGRWQNVHRDPKHIDHQWLHRECNRLYCRVMCVVGNRFGINQPFLFARFHHMKKCYVKTTESELALTKMGIKKVLVLRALVHREIILMLCFNTTLTIQMYIPIIHIINSLRYESHPRLHSNLYVSGRPFPQQFLFDQAISMFHIHRYINWYACLGECGDGGGGCVVVCVCVGVCVGGGGGWGWGGGGRGGGHLGGGGGGGHLECWCSWLDLGNDWRFSNHDSECEFTYHIVNSNTLY